MTDPTFGFPQRLRLKTSAQFKAVYDQKRSVSDGRMVVYAAASGLPHPRVGLSVSRKVGNAVVRNRWKRLFREAFRQNQHALPAGLDYILIPRGGQTEPTLDAVTASLLKLAADAARRVRSASGVSGSAPMSWLWRGPAWLLSAGMVGLVRVYQWCIRPLLPPTCRFEPGCSEYMIGAVRKYGPVVGGVKGVWRICRCNPFCKGGYDPP